MTHCQLCGAEAETFRRAGNAWLLPYDSVCRACIQKLFAPTTIVLHGGNVSPSEWVPNLPYPISA